MKTTTTTKERHQRPGRDQKIKTKTRDRNERKRHKTRDERIGIRYWTLTRPEAREERWKIWDRNANIAEVRQKQITRIPKTFTNGRVKSRQRQDMDRYRYRDMRSSIPERDPIEDQEIVTLYKWMTRDKTVTSDRDSRQRVVTGFTEQG